MAETRIKSSGLSANISVSNLSLTGTTSVSGNIVPTSNNAVNLGSPTLRFGSLYLSGNTIDIGGAQITTTTAGDLTFNTSSGNVAITSNTVSFLTTVANTVTTTGNVSFSSNLTATSVTADAYFYTNGAAFVGGAGSVGYTGSAGGTGLGFAIAKSYLSVAALTADTAPTSITAGQFAVIETGSVQDADNAKLYLWSGSAYSYVTDLSGAAGITGPAGYAGSSGSAGTTGYTGSASTVVGYTGSAGSAGNIGTIGYTGSGSGTVSFVAAGTIPTGEVVVLKSDGTVTTAVETTSDSVGTSATIGTGTAFTGVYDPVNQKVVIFYSNGSGMMIVGTVSGNTISFGTASSFTNFSTPESPTAVYHPSSGKIITFFTVGASLRYSIVTISGTTATASTVTEYSAISVGAMDAVLNTATGNIVLVFGTSSAKAVVVSSDGTSLTFGTEVTIASGSASGLTITNDANNNRVVVSKYSNASAGTLYVGTVSGTSISFGTGVDYLSTGSGPTILSYDPVNFRVLVFYSKWSDGTIFYKVGTVSGTSITLGTEASTGLVTRISYSTDFTVSYSSVISKFVIAYRDDNDSGKTKVAFVTNSGGSITVGTPAFVSNTASPSPAVSTNTKLVVGWKDGSNSLKHAVYIPGTTTVQLNNDNYLGISAGAYQTGNVAIVYSAGSVANVSATGLTIGSVYYVSTSTGALGLASTPIVAGLAVATNRILVKQKGDTGYVGSAGTTGNIGYTGSAGTAGSAGTVGYTGSAGSAGGLGYSGSAGAVGYTGSAGVTGYTGSAGSAGTAGYTGSRGTTAFTAGNTAPTSPGFGDMWYRTTNDALYRYLNDGTASYWIDVSGPVNNFGTSAATQALIPLAIGQAYGGGYYAGDISVTGNGVATHRLIIAPIATGLNTSLQLKVTATTTTSTSSRIDGPTNSANMNNGSHPAAQFCEGLTIGGYSDWYLPSINELEICYYNLKPTTYANSYGSGANPNSVPARASNYSSDTIPAKTSVAAFQDGGSEDFITGVNSNRYWSSTQWFDAAGYEDVWIIQFDDGSQARYAKNTSLNVRAVRRVPI